jgi:hypothetical protein
MRSTPLAHRSSVLRGQESVFDPVAIQQHHSRAHSGLRAVSIFSLELKNVQHFEDDDDNDNDPDDVKDVSVHGP